jgi:CheY-like chemotaxis protein
MLAKALIVEDNPINVIVLKKFIEHICTADVVTNGAKALETLAERKYDLLLLDINLGSEQMTGLEVLEEIRRIPDLKSLPVIIVTAYASEETNNQYISQPFTELIIKPIEKEKILAVIGKYIQ